jgi:hypothetical protein
MKLKLSEHVTVFLLFSSSILGTFAMFMPMKSLLILGSGSVPSFFPGFLATQGPLVSALLLLVGAVIASLLQKISDYGAKQFTASTGPPAFTGGEDRGPAGPLVRKMNILLVVTIGLFISYLSWIFLLLLFLWLALLRIFLEVKPRLSRRAAFHATEPDSIALQFGSQIRVGALWVSVSAAILTLVLDESQLGLTGILLSAVFGRKLQIALSQLVTRTPERGDDGYPEDPDRKNAWLKTPHKPGAAHPLEVLSTRRGLEALINSYSDRGASDGSLAILGPVARDHVTLAINPETSHEMWLTKIFTINSRHVALDEVSFRTSDMGVSPYQDRLAILTEREHFPAVEVDYTKDPLALDGEKLPSPKAVDRWLIELDIRCIASQEFQTKTESSRLENTAASLLLPLERMSIFPGPQRAICHELSVLVQQIVEDQTSSPRVWVPKRPLRPEDFRFTVSGSCELISFPGWTIGRPGESWQNGKTAHLINSEAPDLAEKLGDQLKPAQGQAILRSVNAALTRNDVPQLKLLTKNLKALLREVEDRAGQN